MLDVYNYHTAPDQLHNYYENVVRGSWFKNIREMMDRALDELNGAFEVMHDDNPDEEQRSITLDYRVDEESAKIYTTVGEYVGHMDLQGSQIVCFNSDDEELCTIATKARRNLATVDKLAGYLCDLFGIDPEELY